MMIVALRIIVMKTIYGPGKKMFTITVHGLANPLGVIGHLNIVKSSFKTANAPYSVALEDQLGFSLRMLYLLSVGL